MALDILGIQAAVKEVASQLVPALQSAIVASGIAVEDHASIDAHGILDRLTGTTLTVAFSGSALVVTLNIPVKKA